MITKQRYRSILDRQQLNPRKNQFVPEFCTSRCNIKIVQVITVTRLDHFIFYLYTTNIINISMHVTGWCENSQCISASLNVYFSLFLFISRLVDQKIIDGQMFCVLYCKKNHICHIVYLQFISLLRYSPTFYRTQE